MEQTQTSWRNDPRLKGMNPKKLDLLVSFSNRIAHMPKKGIDETWLENGKDVDPDKIIIRYADVLLMYAEAKIELNQIDQSVLDAINRVRARAYGVDYTNISAYPAITTTSQQKLRTIIRNERRVEFAKEGLRYMDLVRDRKSVV